jgi:hypothetical protein
MQSQVKYTMGFYFSGQFTHITAWEKNTTSVIMLNTNHNLTKCYCKKIFMKSFTHASITIKMRKFLSPLY